MHAYRICSNDLFSSSIEATELKCGGLVLVAWAETAASKPISLPPAFRRSLLALHRPGSHDPSLDRLYVPVSSLPPPPSPSPDQEAAVNRIYYVTVDDIAQMQAAAGFKRTKIEAFTAYLWRVLARAARPQDKVCRMGAVVDGRSRLARDGEMAGYFGNVLSIPYESLGVEKLKGGEGGGEEEEGMAASGGRAVGGHRRNACSGGGRGKAGGREGRARASRGGGGGGRRRRALRWGRWMAAGK